jgi:mono/diheme cytochrome c family protein
MENSTAPRGMQPPDKKPVRITVPERRHARYGDPFFPKVPFQAIFYISGIFGMLLFLAISSPAPLQDPADPLNHLAIDPKPEWYFMFLFQLLKYFSGPFVPIGTVVIPTILVLLLLFLPFYDRNWARKIVRRPVAAVSMTGAMIGIMVLMWGGLGFPKPTFVTTSTVATGGTGGGASGAAISPAVAKIFQARCATCHISTNSGGLKLDSYASLLAGGTTVPGSVIVPGAHAKSILWQITSGATGPWPGGQRMPFGGPYLSASDETTIASWIDGLGASSGGAKPSGTAPAAGSTPAASAASTVAATAAGGTTPSSSGAQVSFKADIQSIFQARCATCHIQSTSGNLSLSSYDTLMKGSTALPGTVVKAGDHANSILWQITNASGAWPGGQRMPFGGPYLSSAQVASIAAWIDQGAKNN